MSKETPVVLTEVWQLLIEYIPRRDQEAAADELIRYLVTVLSKEELDDMSDMDGDLSDAYLKLEDEENDVGYDPDEDFEEDK